MDNSETETNEMKASEVPNVAQLLVVLGLCGTERDEWGNGPCYVMLICASG